MAEPNASGKIEVSASPEQVYALVSDPAKLATLAAEYGGHRWLDGATSAKVGARFRGSNKNGVRRWSTLSTIVEADEGARFTFDVKSFGVPVARWQYDIEPAGEGCVVTESTWDHRPSWFKFPAGLATGVFDRDPHNHANIEATLRRLKSAAEGA